MNVTKYFTPEKIIGNMGIAKEIADKRGIDGFTKDEVMKAIVIVIMTIEIVEKNLVSSLGKHVDALVEAVKLAGVEDQRAFEASKIIIQGLFNARRKKHEANE